MTNNFVQQWMILRRVLFKGLFAISLTFVGLCTIHQSVFQWLARPFFTYVPDATHLIAIHLLSPLWVSIKVCFTLAWILCLPYLLFQLGRFIQPALYRHERKLLWSVAWAGGGLFYAGMAFCYWVVLPLFFKFVWQFTPRDIQLMPDIQYYVQLLFQLLFAFGLAFEMPIIIVLLVKTKCVSIKQLSSARRHVIVFAFVIGMLLTPPDVISQILLAIPLWILYECGLFWSKMAHTKSNKALKQHDPLL